MNAQALPAPEAGATAAAAAPCLLVNPQSHSVASGRLAARAIALARASGAPVIEADGPQSIAEGVERALARGMRRLFVLAGDGTVQAIVDRLAALPAGAAPPELLLLGGGRTNLTPADLGGGKGTLASLESALARATRDPAGGFVRQYRHALAIAQPPAPPRHGFFFAAALVDRLIRATHAYRAGGHGSLRTGRLSAMTALLASAIPLVRGREPYACPELDIESPGLGRLSGPSRVLIATTLCHAGRRFNPYAERGEGALRVTAVAKSAPEFWRSLPRLLSGRFTASMSAERGYLSGRSQAMSVTGLDGYTLDGQSFAADPVRPVAITVGPRFTFLVP